MRGAVRLVRRGPPRPDPAQLYDAFDGPPDAVVGFLRFLVARHGLAEPVSVLDVGCGTGRLLGPLTALGWTVDGIEPDADFRVAAQAVPGVQVTAGAFQDVAAEQAYDLVIAVNSVFHHLHGAAAQDLALRRAWRALRPGGLLVLDLADFGWIRAHYRAPVPREGVVMGRPVVLKVQHEITDERFVTRQVFHVGAETVEKVHDYAVIDGARLAERLRETGFVGIARYPGWQARAPTEGGGRMVLVGRR